MDGDDSGVQSFATPWELQVRLWILEILEAEGGSAEARLVTEKLGRRIAKLDDDLDKLFMETLTKYGVSSEESRTFRNEFLAWAKPEGHTETRSGWREDVSRAVELLVLEGYLKKGSPTGTWEITRKGMVYLMSGELIRQIRMARKVV